MCALPNVASWALCECACESRRRTATKVRPCPEGRSDIAKGSPEHHEHSHVSPSRRQQMRSSTKATSHNRRGLRLFATVCLVAGAALALSSAASASSIVSAGPLTSITISPDLNCSVNHSGDSSPEWFGTTACGTARGRPVDLHALRPGEHPRRGLRVPEDGVYADQPDRPHGNGHGGRSLQDRDGRDWAERAPRSLRPTRMSSGRSRTPPTCRSRTRMPRRGRSGCTRAGTASCRTPTRVSGASMATRSRARQARLPAAGSSSCSR